MFGHEPAAIIGFLSALAAVVLFYGLMTREEVELWMGAVVAAIPLVQAFLTRSKVISVNKIRDAGLTPSQVNRMAKDPHYPRNEG